MDEEPKTKGYIHQGWLVILLALLYGGGLAGVERALSGKIAENKKAETYSVIPVLVPGADSTRVTEQLVKGEDGKDTRVYKAIGSDGSHLGWVLPAGGQGFADRIELLIGLDRQVSTITGIYVLGQKETPGLGDYITTEDFRSRFKGKSADAALTVVTSDPTGMNEVRALTGATISSESVSGIVNQALANLKETVRALADPETSDDKAAIPSPGN